MNDAEKELIYKTDKLSLNEKGAQQLESNNLDDIDDTPSRARFFSSMNYKEYVTKFDKPPARPKIMPEKAETLNDNEFSLDGSETLTEMRSYSHSLPMRPFESGSGSGSGNSSLKSTFEQKTIEEEEEDEEEVGGVVEDPIYALDSLPQKQ